jgi:hypothetical protein
MSTVSYENFLPEVMQFVRDVPEIVAVNAIRNATIEFCEKTLFLQQAFDGITTVAGVNQYELDPDGDYKVVDIMEIWNGDQFLIPKPIEELTRIYRTSNWQNLTGNPYYFFRPSPSILQLVPTPQITQAGYLKIRAAVAPTRASTTVDSDVYERWLEIIAAGAKARLYATPNQPYYDPKAAMMLTKYFSDMCNDILRRVNKGNVRASGQVEFQRWA